MQKEIWKDIPGYEDMYQVSSEGRVKSLERYIKDKGGLRKCKERYLLPGIKKGGYESVKLCKEATCRSHQIYKLVAIAFLGHIPCGYNMIVDHINNNKSDNRLSNLQLISQRENSTKDRKPSSGFTGVYKRKNGRYKSMIYDKKQQIYLGTFDTPEEAHEAYLNKLREIQHI